MKPAHVKTAPNPHGVLGEAQRLALVAVECATHGDKPEARQALRRAQECLLSRDGRWDLPGVSAARDRLLGVLSGLLAAVEGAA